MALDLKYRFAIVDSQGNLQASIHDGCTDGAVVTLSVRETEKMNKQINSAASDNESFGKYQRRKQKILRSWFDRGQRLAA